MHQKGRNKARIIDIALQAGVSTATVDRVLNNRPGVRQKTIDKVQAAIQSLDRAEQRPRIVPTLDTDIVIDAVIAGGAGFPNEILAAELHRIARERGTTLRFAYPRRLNPFALADALEQSRKRISSGIIVQALDHPLVREKVAEIAAEGIPVVAIMTSLPGSPTIGYVGLDNRAAGRTAGYLMGRLIQQPGDVGIFLAGNAYRSHEEREIGFNTVVREEFSHLNLLSPCRGLDDPEKNYRMASELLESNADLVGIYSMGGGNRGIEKAIIESGRQDAITYIAFNLTPLTRQALINGVIDAVVHQDLARAAELAIGNLINHHTARPLSFPQVPVEIIMRENIR